MAAFAHDESVVLKFVCNGQIFRSLLESGVQSLDLDAVQQAAVATCGSTDVRYVAPSGICTSLSESTFKDFLATATRPTESASQILRLEVVKNIEGAWQEDPRDIEELLAQFSEDDVAKTQPQRHGKKKKKKRQVAKRTSKVPHVGGVSDSTDSDVGEECENCDSLCKEVLLEESLSTDSEDGPPFKHCKLAVEQTDWSDSEEESGHRIIRSLSCPCLPVNSEDVEEETEDMPENHFWPATPESTPPQTPRDGTSFMWFPMPVMVMPAIPIPVF